MNGYIKKICMVLLAGCMALGGCSKKDWSTNPPSAEKIAATNKIREQLGIRKIKDSWSFYGRRAGSVDWKETPSGLCKRVQYDKKYEAILWEEDNYYTGRQITSADRETSLLSERLVLFYDYRTKRFGLAVTTDNEEIIAMEETLLETTPEGEHEQLGFMGGTNEETLTVVDKILKKWGLERL